MRLTTVKVFNGEVGIGRKIPICSAAWDDMSIYTMQDAQDSVSAIAAKELELRAESFFSGGRC